VEHLYSVAALTSNTGAVLERYRYDAYGQRTVLAADGTTVRAASSYGNQVGFTGRYHDWESGLTCFRARYFDHALGRFIGRDPAGYVDGTSLYSAYFVPNHLDPSGKLVAKGEVTNCLLGKVRALLNQLKTTAWAKGARGSKIIGAAEQYLDGNDVSMDYIGMATHYVGNNPGRRVGMTADSGASGALWSRTTTPGPFWIGTITWDTEIYLVPQCWEKGKEPKGDDWVLCSGSFDNQSYIKPAPFSEYGEYVCERKEAVCGFKKNDLVNSFIHESLHAFLNGSKRVNGQATVQEEHDAFNAGDEATSAMGLPGIEEGWDPNAYSENPNDPSYIPVN
jgi:RHS repeat-associated protein